jgi:glucose-1-phosphate adenylyltransferase
MSTTMKVLPRTHALILAGGRGERLNPLTLFRPKPALSFGGIFRVIDFTLLNCLNSALGRVSLLTQYRHHELHEYVRQSWSEGWRNSARCGKGSVACLPPACGKRYRGTADAVFQNIGVLRSDKPEFVLILSGDHICDMDYRDLIRQHAQTDADLTIAAVEHPIEDAHHFGVLEVDQNFRVVGFQEKPVHPRALPARPAMALVSMGVYVFKTDVLVQTLLDHCGAEERYDFGHDIIPSLIHSACTYAYDFRDDAQDSPGYWRDIGTLDSYYEASMDLVRARPFFNPYIKDGWHSRIVRPLDIGAGVCGTALVSHSVLSSGVQIEEDASVEDSVLMPGVRVGKGARIRRAIVGEGVQVPKVSVSVSTRNTTVFITR